MRVSCKLPSAYPFNTQPTHQPDYMTFEIMKEPQSALKYDFALTPILMATLVVHTLPSHLQEANMFEVQISAFALEQLSQTWYLITLPPFRTRCIQGVPWVSTHTIPRFPHALDSAFKLGCFLPGPLALAVLVSHAPLHHQFLLWTRLPTCRGPLPL